MYFICGQGSQRHCDGPGLCWRLLDARVVIVKSLEPEDHFRKCEVFVGGHPLPNTEGFRGCLRILSMVEEANEDDLFISAISGGTSALMACPIEGLTLEEDILTTDILLKSGANIFEINSIRRHISRINGGQLPEASSERSRDDSAHAQRCHWVSGHRRLVHSSGCDRRPMARITTLQDAKNTIRNYGLENKLPSNVVRFFDNCTEADETPKEIRRLTCFVVNTLPDMCLSAKRIAEKKGIRTVLLTSSLSGSSKDAGVFFAAIAREVHQSGNPVSAPCMFIASGEVSTIIDDPKEVRGQGGPGQEMAVSFAIAARNVPRACLLSIDSEGTDGPTDAAGGLTDTTTFDRAGRLGVNLYEALRNHATYNALGKLGCRVMTGNTGTTLCDLHILYVPDK